MLLVAIAGKARVGKDTIGRHLVREYGFQRDYFAKTLKDMLGAMGYREEDFQTTEQKEAIIPEIGVSYRHLAQTLGTQWGRQLVHNQLWIKMVEKRWKSLCAHVQLQNDLTFGPLAQTRMVLTDCRFPNEQAWVRDVGGVVIHVHGNAGAGMSAEAMAHSSEAGLPVLFGDREIWNQYVEPSEDLGESLRQLRVKVDVLMNELLTERGLA